MSNGLSDDQFDALGELIRQTIREESVTKEEFKEAISHLPTKDEFYKSQSELTAEIKKVREEQSVQAGQISDVTDRVEKIEDHLSMATG